MTQATDKLTLEKLNFKLNKKIDNYPSYMDLDEKWRFQCGPSSKWSYHSTLLFTFIIYYHQFVCLYVSL